MMSQCRKINKILFCLDALYHFALQNCELVERNPIGKLHFRLAEMSAQLLKETPEDFFGQKQYYLFD